MSKTVMLLAGEASGDKHGAKIAEYLMATDNSIRCTGMGGKHMRTAGVELVVDSSNIAVVGLFEVLAHWDEIQAAIKTLKQSLADNPPDLLVLIDYPEFNLKIAAFAKAAGIKVLFYISPQVWAWRSWRAKKIGRAIDKMAVIFPFEETFYRQHNIPVSYVGHPLAGEVKPSRNREQAISAFGLQAGAPTVALLPGSRNSEIKRILPILAEAAIHIRQTIDNVQFILPVASSLNIDDIREKLSVYPLPITLVDGQSYDVVSCSDAAIVASGTATLEVALLQTPMAIVYRVSPVSYAIFKRLIKVKYVGLANIVAGQQVAKEFIQDNARPEDIAREIIRQLTDHKYRDTLKKQLQTVGEKLGNTDGIKGIGELVLKMLTGFNI
jgi:lipid-A-disaccharide synthase